MDLEFKDGIVTETIVVNKTVTRTTPVKNFIRERDRLTNQISSMQAKLAEIVAKIDEAKKQGFVES